MVRWKILLTCVWAVVLPTQLFAASWDTVVFQYDFGQAAAGRPDPAVWMINHPGSWWWVQGRTHFPNPDPWLATGEFPRVENGACVIRHHLYNPYDLGTPKSSFLGGELRTVMQFNANKAYRFEARVRGHAYPSGLVTSFFTYGWDGANSDEIDDEFVSKKVNDNQAYPNGDAVLTNPWNESGECPQYVAPDGLNLAAWNTFRIYWYPALRRVDWTWLDPVNGETPLRSETVSGCVPDEAMQLYFNFWAPSPNWGDAYDANLQPVNDPGQDVIQLYEIQSVEVRTMTLAPVDFDQDGDVDHDDFTAFESCASGSTIPYTSGCGAKDRDSDGDVDQSDFGVFQRCCSGANVPADATCAN